ncbi:MAG: hypothetical protein Q9167_007739 [Letrouitia subvulpina]
MPAPVSVNFQRTKGGRDWSFLPADLDCILLLVKHGDPKLHFKERCLEILKSTNQHKYEEFSPLTLLEVLGDFKTWEYYQHEEWCNLDPNNLRVLSAKQKYQFDLQDAIKELNSKLEVKKEFQQIPQKALIWIALMRNHWIKNYQRTPREIAHYLNEFYASSETEGKRYTEEIVEIIYSYLILSAHGDIYRKWSVELKVPNDLSLKEFNELHKLGQVKNGA